MLYNNIACSLTSVVPVIYSGRQPLTQSAAVYVVCSRHLKDIYNRCMWWIEWVEWTGLSNVQSPAKKQLRNAVNGLRFLEQEHIWVMHPTPGGN